MLTFKNKKETIKELAHVDVYSNGTYVGYIIKNNSTLALINENWNFVSKTLDLPMMFDKTKKALIDKINLHIK